MEGFTKRQMVELVGRLTLPKNELADFRRDILNSAQDIEVSFNNDQAQKWLEKLIVGANKKLEGVSVPQFDIGKMIQMPSDKLVANIAVIFSEKLQDVFQDALSEVVADAGARLNELKAERQSVLNAQKTTKRSGIKTEVERLERQEDTAKYKYKSGKDLIQDGKGRLSDYQYKISKIKIPDTQDTTALQAFYENNKKEIMEAQEARNAVLAVLRAIPADLDTGAIHDLKVEIEEMSNSIGAIGAMDAFQGLSDFVEAREDEIVRLAQRLEELDAEIASLEKLTSSGNIKGRVESVLQSKRRGKDGTGRVAEKAKNEADNARHGYFTNKEQEKIDAGDISDFVDDYEMSKSKDIITYSQALLKLVNAYKMLKKEERESSPFKYLYDEAINGIQTAESALDLFLQRIEEINGAIDSAAATKKAERRKTTRTSNKNTAAQSQNVKTILQDVVHAVKGAEDHKDVSSLYGDIQDSEIRRIFNSMSMSAIDAENSGRYTDADYKKYVADLKILQDQLGLTEEQARELWKAVGAFNDKRFDFALERSFIQDEEELREFDESANYMDYADDVLSVCNNFISALGSATDEIEQRVQQDDSSSETKSTATQEQHKIKFINKKNASLEEQAKLLNDIVLAEQLSAKYDVDNTGFGEPIPDGNDNLVDIINQSREALVDFRKEYDYVILTMQDGSKKSISLGDLSQSIDGITSDLHNISNIDFSKTPIADMTGPMMRLRKLMDDVLSVHKEMNTLPVAAASFGDDLGDTVVILGNLLKEIGGANVDLLAEDKATYESAIQMLELLRITKSRKDTIYEFDEGYVAQNKDRSNVNVNTVNRNTTRELIAQGVFGNDVKFANEFWFALENKSADVINNVKSKLTQAIVSTLDYSLIGSINNALSMLPSVVEYEPEVSAGPTDNSSGEVAENQKKIESYEELIAIVEEYFRLKSQLKDAIPYTGMHRDAEVMHDRYFDIDDDGAKRQQIMKDFNALWSLRQKMKTALKTGDVYTDADGQQWAVSQRDIIDEKTGELNALAAAYVVLGGAIEDFSSKEKKAVAERSSKLYYADELSDYVQGVETDKYNKPIQNRMDDIEEKLTKQQINPESLAVFEELELKTKATEDGIDRIADAIGIAIPQAAAAAEDAIDDVSHELSETSADVETHAEETPQSVATESVSEDLSSLEQTIETAIDTLKLESDNNNALPEDTVSSPTPPDESQSNEPPKKIRKTNERVIAGDDLAKETTLKAIKELVNSINGKVVTGHTDNAERSTRRSKKKQGEISTAVALLPESSEADNVNDNVNIVVRTNADDANSFDSEASDKLVERVKTAYTSLVKYKAMLQEAGQLHGDLATGIDSLVAELFGVAEDDDLAIWKEHFSQFKNGSEIIKSLSDDYRKLGEVQAKIETETDEATKQKYLSDQKIIQDRINAKEVDVTIGDDRFETVRSAAYDEAKRNIANAKRIKDSTQAIKDQKKELDKLLALYEDFGTKDAEWNYAGGTKEAVERERDMLNVLKQIREQRIAMGLFDNDTAYANEIEAARTKGFEKVAASKRLSRAKETDKNDMAHIKEDIKLVKKYQAEIGKLNADLIHSAGPEETDEIKRQIAQKELYIKLKRKDIEIDQKELDQIYQRAYINEQNHKFIIEAHKQSAHSVKKAQKEEQDGIKKLIDLYKQLGTEIASRNYAETDESKAAHQQSIDELVFEIANSSYKNKDTVAAGLAAAKEAMKNKSRTLRQSQANKTGRKRERDETSAAAETARQQKKKPLFNADVKKEVSSLELMYAKLLANGQLADAVKTKWDSLWASLDNVKDEDGLKLWRKELAKTKNEINEIIVNNKAFNDQVNDSFSDALALTKLYNEMSVKAEKADDANLKNFYAGEADNAWIGRDTILRSFKLSSEQQAKLDELEEDRQRKITEIVKKRAAKSNAENIKEEAEAIKELTKLYEQLGEAQAKRDSGLFNEAEAAQAARDAADIRGKLQMVRRGRNISRAQNDQFRNATASAYNKVVDGKILKNAKDTEEKIKNIENRYRQLGVLQAKVDTTHNLRLTEELKQKTEDVKKDIQALRLSAAQTKELEDRLAVVKKEAHEKEVALLRQAKLQDDIDRAAKKDKASARLGRAKTVLQRSDDVNAEHTALGIDDDVWNSLPEVSELNAQTTALRQLYNTLENADAVSPKQKQQLIEQTAIAQEHMRTVKGILTQYRNLSGEDVREIGRFDSTISVGWVQQLEQQVKALTNGKAVITGYDSAARSLTYTMDDGQRNVTQYTAAIRSLDSQMVVLQGETRKTESLLNKITRHINAEFRTITIGTTIRQAASEIRRGVQYVREIDIAMTELKKVTDETEKSYDKFLKTASKTADKVGSTIQEIVSSTADWSRLGYDMTEAASLAESTSVLLNVSEFKSIEDATSALVSTMQAFGYTADNSMYVVDVMNEIGNSFAVSSDGIATALQDSASALMTANNSYEEAVAMVAAANRVTQNPSEVGGALRTISLRLRGTSVSELEEMGEDTTGAVGTKSKLRSKLKGLTGVDILTDTGAYKSTYDILLEISKVWKDLTDEDRAGALELISGKNRANVASALLTNTKDLEAAYASALEAEGSAYLENQKYLDSIQGRIDQFTNAVQTMWSNTLQDEWVKGFVEAGTAIINLVDNFGLLKVAADALFTILLTKGKFSETMLPAFSGIFEGLIGKVKNVTSTFKKNNLSDAIVGDVQSAEVTVNDFAKDLREGLWTHVGIDTSAIDDKISSVESKLMRAQQKVTYLKGFDRDFYAQAGSLKPSHDMRANVDEAQADVDALNNQLATLRQERDDFINTQSLSIAESLFAADNAKVEQGRQSLITALDQIKGKTLEFGNLKDVDVQLDSLTNAAQKGNVEFTKQVELLGDGNIALKAYIASVEDGKYTTTGYINFVKKHNAELNALEKTMGKAMLKQQAMNLAMNIGISLLITNAISLATKGISWLSDKMSGLSQSAEEAQDEFEQLNSQLSNCKSDLTSLESELTSTQERIDTLLDSGTLTFVEQEELARLQETSAELEKQIALKTQLQTGLQKGTNAKSITATNAYLNTTAFDAEDTRTERSDKNSELGKTIGALVGTAAGAALGFIPAIGPMLALALSGAIGSIGGAIGGAIGSVVGAADYDDEQTVKEALDNMSKSRAELIKARDEAYKVYINNPMDEDAVESYENAEETLNKYDSKMAEHINHIQTNYNAMDWDTATEQQRDAMIEQADILDKYAIEMGGDDAKASAIDRIFGAEASDKLKAVKKGLEAAAEAGKDFDIEDFFGNDTVALERFTARLRDMGIYLYEVENHFKAAAKAGADAEDELADSELYDVATSINSVTESVEKLKSAFEEIREHGSVTAGTLVDLQEVFGGLGSAWAKYCDTVYSSVSSTEEMTEATNELVTAYLREQMQLGNLTKEQKWTYVLQLKNLGIENAKEFVDDQLQESMYAEIEDAAKVAEEKIREEFDKQNQKRADKDSRDRKWSELTDEEKQKLADDYGLAGEVSLEDAQKIADEYDLDVDNETLAENVRLINEKIAAEQELDNLLAKQAAAQSEHNKWEKEKQDAEAAVDAAKKELDYLQTKNINPYFSTNADDWTEIVDEHGNKFYHDEKHGDLVEAGEQSAIGKQVEELLNAKSAYEDAVNDLNNLAAAEPELISQDTIDEAENVVKDATEAIEKEATAEVQIKLDLKYFNEDIDEIQDAYSTIDDVVKQYNKNKYLSLDNLQALLNLEPEYLACLKMENGQLSLNQAAMQSMIEAKLAEAEATAVQEAMTELNTLAEQAQKEAIENSSNAAINSIDNIGAYASSLNDVTQQAIVAAGAVSEFNAAVAGAEEAGVSQEDIDAVYARLQTKLDMINATRVNLSSNFDKIVSPDSDSSKDDESALDKIKKKYEHKLAMLDAQKTYLENEISRLEAENKPVSKSLYEEQIKIEEKKLKLYEQERAEILATMNTVEKGSDDWNEMAEEVWGLNHAIQESTLSVVELKDAITQLYIDAFDDIGGAHDNKLTFFDDQKQYIEDYINYLETLGVDVPDEMYEKLISVEEKSLEQSYEKLADLENQLAEAEKNGLEETDEEWVRINADIREVESSILASKTAIEEWNNAIREAEWGKFDEIMNRVNDVKTETDNVAGLFDTDDVANEDGTWTKEGIAQLGLHYQQMMSAQAAAEEYAKAIEELNEEYETTDLSESEYYERLQELKDGQWDAINSTEEYKESIVDLHEARVDEIENGIEKEIEAYEELIKVKKDELDAERDLHDFRNNVKDQTKDIAALERKIASMSGSTDAATVAERTRLEAELREKQDSLNDTYYDHAMDSQSSALDDELESFEKNKNDYLEQLRQTLEQTKFLVESTMYDVLINADVVLDGIQGKADEYGITLSPKLTDPWTAASAQAQQFKTDVGESLAALTNDDGIISAYNQTANSLIAAVFASGQTQAGGYVTSVREVLDAVYQPGGSIYTFSVESGKLVSAPFEGGDTLATNFNDAVNNVLLLMYGAGGSIDNFSTNSDNLIHAPFANGSGYASEFSNNVLTELSGIYGTNGSAWLFNEQVKSAFEGAFGAGNMAADGFKGHVANQIDLIRQDIYSENPQLTSYLEQPFKTASSYAKNTFKTDIENTLTDLVKTAKAKADEIDSYATDIVNDMNRAQAAIDNTGGKSSGGGGGDGDKTPDPAPTVKGYRVVASWSDGNKTVMAQGSAKSKADAEKDALNRLGTEYYKYVSAKFPNAREGVHEKAWADILKQKKYSITSAPYYAKGTTGTTKDQWAITDEPQYGDELVLVPGKNGNLSYMRKGTAVIPADISENLMKLGMNPDFADMEGAVKNINLMTNYVNKPEIKLDIENFLHVDNVSQDTMPELKKFVKEQVNTMVRQLNYGLKRN